MAFLSRFDKAAEGGGVPPDRVEEGQERAYLQCRFNLARAYGKLELADYLVSSQREYEGLHAYFERNKVEGMDGEARVTKEMTELLPAKIAMAQKRADQARAAAAS